MQPSQPSPSAPALAEGQGETPMVALWGRPHLTSPSQKGVKWTKRHEKPTKQLGMAVAHMYRSHRIQSIHANMYTVYAVDTSPHVHV